MSLLYKIFEGEKTYPDGIKVTSKNIHLFTFSLLCHAVTRRPIRRRAGRSLTLRGAQSTCLADRLGLPHGVVMAAASEAGARVPSPRARWVEGVAVF